MKRDKNDYWGRQLDRNLNEILSVFRKEKKKAKKIRKEYWRKISMGNE